MSFNRTLSFFKSVTNNTLGFVADNGDVDAFVQTINANCTLGLEPVNGACNDPASLVLGNIGACDERISWLKQFGIYTCEELSEFSNATLDCIEDSSRNFFNSQEPKCEAINPWIWIGSIIGMVVLIIVILACVFGRKRCEDNRQYQPI